MENAIKTGPAVSTGPTVRFVGFFLVFFCVCVFCFVWGFFGFLFFFCLQLKSQPDIYFKKNILHKKHLGNSIGTYHFHLATTLRSWNCLSYVCLQCLAKLRMDKYYTYKCQVSYFQECYNAPNVSTLCKIINKNLQIFKKCRE